MNGSIRLEAIGDTVVIKSHQPLRAITGMNAVADRTQEEWKAKALELRAAEERAFVDEMERELEKLKKKAATPTAELIKEARVPSFVPPKMDTINATYVGPDCCTSFTFEKDGIQFTVHALNTTSNTVRVATGVNVDPLVVDNVSLPKATVQPVEVVIHDELG